MIPNCQHIVATLAAQYPQEWKQAHRGGPHTEAFIRRLAWVLHSTIDAGFGLLGQYGDRTRIADDVIMYLGEGPGVDAGTGRPQSGFDVIASAGSDNASPAWIDISGPGPAIWVQPEPVGAGPVHPPPVDPTPPPAQDLGAVLAMAQKIAQDLAAFTTSMQDRLTGLALETSDIKARLSEVEQHSVTAANEAFNAAVRASEIKTRLDQSGTEVVVDWPIYEGRVFGATVRLVPKP